MTPTTAAALPAVPPDVRAFADANGAAQYLDDILAMTRDLFPSAELSLALEDDPEIPFESYVLVEARSTFESPEDIRGALGRWGAERERIWPAWEARVIRLWLDPVEA